MSLSDALMNSLNKGIRQELYSLELELMSKNKKQNIDGKKDD